jgi:hypothetical protein
MKDSYGKDLASQGFRGIQTPTDLGIQDSDTHRLGDSETHRDSDTHRLGDSGIQTPTDLGIQGFRHPQTWGFRIQTPTDSHRLGDSGFRHPQTWGFRDPQTWEGAIGQRSDSRPSVGALKRGLLSRPGNETGTRLVLTATGNEGNETGTRLVLTATCWLGLTSGDTIPIIDMRTWCR